MSAAVASIDAGPDGALRLSGPIGYGNAARMLPRGRAALAAGGLDRIDLSGLQSADSATLAMLLVWSAESSRRGRSLRITGAPDSLRALARLCDVEGVLHLE